jgi:hypothetical protein
VDVNADDASFEAFTAQCADAAADLALFFVGAPEHEMMLQLEQVQSNLAAELADTFGVEVAAEFARRFVTAVAGRRREIEAGANHATPKPAPQRTGSSRAGGQCPQ